MKRVHLTSETARWFNAETAELFKEATYWDGNNWISKATGSQWNHEALYLTASGAFILNTWSQWQGTCETYEKIGKKEAMEWLIANEHHEDVERLFGEDTLKSYEI